MAVSPDTLRLLDGMRISMSEPVDAQAERIILAWATAWNELAAEWDAALADLIATSKDGRWPSRRDILRAKRVQRALEATRQAIFDLADDLPITVAQALPAMTDEAAQWSRRLAASQFPTQAGTAVTVMGTFGRLDTRALTAIVARTTEQVTSLTRPLTPQMEREMKSALIRGIAVGDNPRTAAADMLARLEGVFNGGRNRALVIARTEMLSAYREANRVGEESMKDVLQGWTWCAALDRRTCPSCLAKHGTEHPLAEAGPLGHQQCVLPGAIVSGPRALASTTRWFDGEVVDIETRSGRILSVTENHPILTPNGWVAAGLLCEGDDVVTGSGTDGPAVGRSPHDYQIPSLIEDVAQTLGGALPVDAVSVPTAPEDFHGDGAGSQVHVVRTNGLLWDHLEPTSPQACGELEFVVRDVGLKALPRGGALGLLLQRLGNASLCIVRRSHQLPVLLRRASVGHGPIDFETAPSLHSGGIEAVVDRPTRHPVTLGKGVGRLAREVSGDDLRCGQVTLGQQRGGDVLDGQRPLVGSRAPLSTLLEDSPQASGAYPMPTSDDLASFAGEVVADGVLNVNRRRWQGHVYNLQTETGWFLVNGILTHNCRCARLPLSKSWADLGFPEVSEPKSLLPDSRSWFDDQSQDDRLAIMGKSRLELLDSGKVGWDDLTTKRTTPGWRDSWAPTSLADLRSKAKP